MEECRVKYTAIAGHNGKFLVWVCAPTGTRSIAVCDNLPDASLIAYRLNMNLVGTACDMPGTDGGFTMGAFKGEDVPNGSYLYALPPGIPQ
jgi:hypothetical protein